MPVPYTVKLDADAARELTVRGATLLLLGVPENTILGIDQQSFVVGPLFQGVKMVPPGPHVVSYNSSSGQGNVGPATSFFLHLRGSQVVVRRWDAQEEVLEPLADEDEVERYTQGVKRFDFDRGLAPYDLGSYTRWQQLSSYITPAAIAALQPTSGNINILAEADPGDAAPATAAEAALQQQLQAGREAAAARQAAGQRSAAPVQGTAGADGGSSGKEEAMQCDQQQQGQQQQQQQEKQQQPQPAPPPPEQAAPHAGRCFYTPLPRLVKRGGLSPAELTALNLDKSRVLEEVLVQKFNGSEDAFLGEFQFAFIAFLVGQSLEGFSQWKAFLHLLFGCDEAPLGMRAGLFTHFLAALRAQLVQSLGGGTCGEQAAAFGSPMMDELLDDSFLRRLCTQFFEMLYEERAALAPDLAAQAAAVSEVLARTLGWGVLVVTGQGEGLEDEEEGPVVVEGVDVAEP